MNTASKASLWIIGIFICLLLMAKVTLDNREAKLQSTPEGRAFIVKRDAENLAQEAALAARNARIAFDVEREQLAKTVVRSQAKDPDSVEFMEVASTDEAVCVIYTATNSFGGRVKGVAVLTEKGMSYKVKDFNKYC